MEYLAVNRPLPTVSAHRLRAAVPEHLAWVEQLRARGTLVRASRWGRGGMCIVRAPHEQAAREIVATDPPVVLGLVELEIAELEAEPSAT